MSDWNKQIIEEFRANEGRVGGHFANATLLLLHTTGAKSGLGRINPLVTVKDGDRLVVAASKGGAESSPDWYYNLLANPEVTIEYGTETFKTQAEVPGEPERTELYGKLAASFGAFAEYEKQVKTRVIPIVTFSL